MTTKKFSDDGLSEKQLAELAADRAFRESPEGRAKAAANQLEFASHVAALSPIQKEAMELIRDVLFWTGTTCTDCEKPEDDETAEQWAFFVIDGLSRRFKIEKQQ
jgi:hypothetical protein